ncbi:AraC family transcriptional regulator [Amycolatopsis nigrescens]|uniref:AraC family transcriptional regulator n=1 Tax=Amycolatopsis nigrescens TaxID=381445 RepID=UPI0003660CD4|nr:AraC family transcriptional regulator [Amycolatopsis nigrescens]
MDDGRVTDGGERGWVRYWRSPHLAVETMHASFQGHVYRRHSHDTYSFGVTEAGAQSFTCRGARHTSAAGMVMALNPDEPHDGSAAAAAGFTYRIVYLGPELVRDVLSDLHDRPVPLPLFADPVTHDPELAEILRTLYTVLTGNDSALERDERIAAALVAVTGRHATRPFRPDGRAHALPSEVAAVRDLLHADLAAEVGADDLARVAGTSRFAVYRAFRAAFGMSPSEYQRQLRLREARRQLAMGRPAAAVATDVGFADQAHLTRWFTRHYGITPGTYQRAA